jgi:ABC-2 type transport system permease protein
MAEDRSLFQLLEKWGVRVDDKLVMSDRNAPFPVQVPRQIPGGPTLQTIELVPYPFFPDLRGEQLNLEHAALAGIAGLTMPWSSPVSLVAETLENRTSEWLVRTDAQATLRADGKIDPERTGGGLAWPATGEPKQETLGLALVGKFPSYFADLPNPNVEGAEGPDTSGQTLKSSVEEGRLVVLGSSELTSDLLVQIASRIQSDQHAGNVQLLQNLLDWTLQDTELLSIRTAGAFSRTIRPVTDAEASAIEIRTWLLVLLPVLVVVGIPYYRRQRTTPIPPTAMEA